MLATDLRPSSSSGIDDVTRLPGITGDGPSPTSDAYLRARAEHRLTPSLMIRTVCPGVPPTVAPVTRTVDDPAGTGPAHDRMLRRHAPPYDERRRERRRHEPRDPVRIRRGRLEVDTTPEEPQLIGPHHVLMEPCRIGPGGDERDHDHAAPTLLPSLRHPCTDLPAIGRIDERGRDPRDRKPVECRRRRTGIEARPELILELADEALRGPPCKVHR